MAVTRGSQAVIRRVEETTPGTTPTSAPAWLLPSKEVTRIRWLVDLEMKEAVDVDDVDVAEFFSAKTVYGVEVEYVLYNVDRMTEAWSRASDTTAKSFSFEIIPNQDASTVHYIRGSGWRPKTSTLVGRVGEAYVVRDVYEGGKWSAPVTADPIGTGTRQAKSAITDARRTWASGAITLNGSAWATLLNEFELTVDHQTAANYTSGSADPVAGATEFKKRLITGTASFSLEDGTKTLHDLVVAGATHSIVVPFSTTTGQPKITFSGVRFPRIEAEITPDTGILMGRQPFRATTYAQGTV